MRGGGRTGASNSIHGAEKVTGAVNVGANQTLTLKPGGFHTKIWPLMPRRIVTLLSLAPLFLAHRAGAAEADLIATYNQFRKAAPDPSHVAVAENLTIKKDAATFQFRSGTLYALEPVLGKVAGVVFIGDGVFSFEPPDPAEQKHLGRFANGQTKLEEPFKEAVFYFTDSTFAELSAGASFKAGNADAAATGALNDFRKTYRDGL